MTRAPVRVSRAKLAALRADPAMTTNDIAAAIGVNRSHVARVAQRLGLPPLKCGRKTVIQREPFASLWLAGVSTREMAAALGFTRNYATQLAARFGLPPRQQGARPKITLADWAQAQLASRMAVEAEATRAAMRLSEMVDGPAGNWKAA